jgi:hypothetical protein
MTVNTKLKHSNINKQYETPRNLSYELSILVSTFTIKSVELVKRMHVIMLNAHA